MKIEEHFNRIISDKEIHEYNFDISEMGSKDRHIASVLQGYGLEKKRCLDIGPGTGRWLQFLKHNNAAWLGAVDISEEVLARCRSYTDYTQKIDVESDHINLENKTVDVVIAIEVLEHILEPENLLSEIRRVLKPEGMVLMTMPNIISFISRLRMLFGLLPVAIASDPTHVRFYRKQEIYRIFESVGFSVEFIPTSFSLVPNNPKSRIRIKTNQLFSSFDDSLVFRVTIN